MKDEQTQGTAANARECNAGKRKAMSMAGYAVMHVALLAGYGRIRTGYVASAQ